MKNPLNRRIGKELKDGFAKYLIIFLFMGFSIAIVSGFLVAAKSMTVSYKESFDKYNIEHGNFELMFEASEDLFDKLNEGENNVYKNYYIERDAGEDDTLGTLRIFAKRKDVNLECLMEGEFPKTDKDIAIDRLYAENNGYEIGDNILIGDEKYKVSGYVSLSDYMVLFSNNSDTMFDAIKFGVGIVTEDSFEKLGDEGKHYVYSWQYPERPSDDKAAKEKSEDYLEELNELVTENGDMLTSFVPEYTNQAIHFAEDDIEGDSAGIAIFLYIVVVIIAFIFSITVSNTITEEAAVIGTLRATGYTKGELMRHYMTPPMIVIFLAAIVGNVLGYTSLKAFAVQSYYHSYSLPTYVTVWDSAAFLKTTVIPLIIMIFINYFMLKSKLSLSPLRFIRHDLSKRKKKKAFRLNTKIPIMHRFRLRVIFQNIPNYITLFFGIFFANFLLLFGIMFSPMLDEYQEQVTSNLISPYQYVLKTPVETNQDNAEKYAVESVQTLGEGNFCVEDVAVYGLSDNTKIIDDDLSNGVVISSAYADKYRLESGDTIKLKAKFTDDEYEFKVKGVFTYPAALTVFVSEDEFCKTFDKDDGYYNGYFSDEKITDIEETNIATTITEDDLTKTSRQLRNSMGNMMLIFDVFSVVMFMLIIYLLAKIIIEKNAQSVSMTKILGYENREINSIYVTSTSVVAVISILVTTFLSDKCLKPFFTYYFSQSPGWLPYYVSAATFAKVIALGLVTYAVVAIVLNQKVKKIPLDEALKNVE